VNSWKIRPELAEEFLEILGGEEGIQSVLADRSSQIEDVVQELSGGGSQLISSNKDSVIKGVRQIKK